MTVHHSVCASAARTNATKRRLINRTSVGYTLEVKARRPSEAISALRMAQGPLLEHFFGRARGLGSQRFWMLPPAVRAARRTTAAGDRQG